MKASAVVGKTIASVEQARMQSSDGAPVYSVQAIRFTDGSVLRFTVGEIQDGHDAATGECYAVVGIYPGRK